ncbi:MAG: site-specific integrase [Thermoproteota archaeon]|nr:site-specific integrase [Thermoproteota archaeon]
MHAHGADPGELISAKWIDLDKENKTIAINNPVKRHNPRILPISRDLVDRLSLLPKRTERIFPMNKSSMYTNFWHQRKRMARNFNNPRLLKIAFTTFRHWKATTQYHCTNDILYVKQLLGHKSLNSTMIYIDIEKATYTKNENSEFITRVTKSDKGARSLIEAGFEYVCQTPNRMMLFRKRK